MVIGEMWRDLANRVTNFHLSWWAIAHVVCPENRNRNRTTFSSLLVGCCGRPAVIIAQFGECAIEFCRGMRGVQGASYSAMRAAKMGWH
jgi:hypothetical protein